MMPAVTTEPSTSANPPRRGVYLLPQLLTTGCLFSGFYSVVAAVDRNFALAGGAIFIAMIALLPSIVLAIGGVHRFPFGGTTVLIAVGVALELNKQIDSQLMMRNYEGFLK